jgi:hypothetical protein
VVPGAGLEISTASFWDLRWALCSTTVRGAPSAGVVQVRSTPTYTERPDALVRVQPDLVHRTCSGVRTFNWPLDRSF